MCEVSETERFQLSVRSVILEVEDLLDAIGASGVVPRRGVLIVVESQLAVLKQVHTDLESKPLTQRLRAMAQSTIGVLRPLLNSIEKSATDSPLPPLDACRRSLDHLAGVLHQ